MKYKHATYVIMNAVAMLSLMGLSCSDDLWPADGNAKKMIGVLDTTTIEQGRNYKLIMGTKHDIYNSGEYIFIYTKGDFFMVKSPNVKDMSGTNRLSSCTWENHLSCLIDLDNFNTYLNLKDINEKCLVYKEICEILSMHSYDSSHIYIGDYKGVYEITKLGAVNGYVANSTEESDMLDMNELRRGVMDGRRYCWLLDKGLHEIIIQYKNGAISDLDTRLVGYLGFEMLRHG